MRAVSLFFIALCVVLGARAQSSRDYSVPLSAIVDTQAPSITIQWPADLSATHYLLSRKGAHDPSWTTFIGLVPGTDSQYVDTQVQKGEVYEYKVQKNAGAYNAYGYLLAGTSREPVASWGRLILVIDTLHLTYLSDHIDQLEEDLFREGWQTKRVYVDRNDPVSSVKAQIQSLYQEDSSTTAVLLLGHVPVPYSGNIVPDGHTNNHFGAWPADVYYGDMDGVWTDAVINVTNMPARTNNIPGDGKFDQSVPPSEVELMVGRIDMANLPAFASSEQELLANYLDKNHAYRTGQWSIRQRAIIDDNFGGFNGEAFASNGWRNFSPLLGLDSIETGDYRTSMNTTSYYWSYGCGGGSYTSANGIGNTNQLATDSLQGIFTMLFGSYFGDWDVNNSFLRAPLAQGNILTNAWAGRPHWQFHHMAQGYPIGHAVRLAQNNNNTYWVVFGGRQIHTALMGDPSLRMHPMSPVDNLVALQAGRDVELTWAKHPKAENYTVYSGIPSQQVWEPLGIATDTRWKDFCRVAKDTLIYAVRANYTQYTPSGSYINNSPMDTAHVILEDRSLVPALQYNIQNDLLTYEDLSVEADSFIIKFGDGQSSTLRASNHQYIAEGTYTIVVQWFNSCSSRDTTFTVEVMYALGVTAQSALLNCSPNPTQGIVKVSYEPGWAYGRLFNSVGQIVKKMESGSNDKFDMQALPNGWYLLQLQTKKGQLISYPLLKQ